MRRKVWKAGPVLNQGTAEACFGFGWAGALIAQPGGQRDVSARLGNQFGRFLYERMLNTYAGKGNVGAQVAQDLGLIDGTRTPNNLAELTDAVTNDGPVVITVPWYMSMWLTGWRYGKVTVEPSADAPVHCLFVRGYDPAKRFGIGRRAHREPSFLLRNSWGHHWGMDRPRLRILTYGDAWVTARDLDLLLTDGDGYNGSACVPIGKKPIDVARILADHAALSAS